MERPCRGFRRKIKQALRFSGDAAALPRRQKWAWLMTFSRKRVFDLDAQRLSKGAC
jgi:hypothetical protein